MANKYTPRTRRLTLREEQLIKRRRRAKDRIAKGSRRVNRGQ